MIALLAGAVAALIIVIIIGVTTNNARQAAQNEINALSTELNNLQAILKYAQSNPLSNSTTAKLATETDLITISHQNDLSKVYTSIDPNAPIDPEAAVTTDLNEAKARGSLDSSYATALREQLLTVCNKLESLYDSATDDQKTALEQTFTDFKELASRLPSST
jgi:hypothetical protein